MNTQISPSTLDPRPSTSAPGPVTQDSALETQDSPKPIYRKIAKLPKPLLDLINSMLDDGHTAPEIITKLQATTDPPLPYPISEQNISDWRKSGYQKYLLHQDLRADIRFIRESAADFSELNQEHQFQNTLIQLGLTDIYRALTDPKTRTDPLNHIRVLNALARLNREALSLRKYDDLRADKAAAQLKPANGTPTEEDYRNSLLLGWEKVTGIKPADHPIGPDLNVLLGLDPPKAPTSAAQQSQIKIQNSKINPPLPSADDPQSAPPAPSDKSASQSKIEIQKSKIEEGEGELVGVSQSQIANRKSKIESDSLPSPQPSTFNLQPATAEPPELCYSCSVPLPPLKPDGTRPSNVCPGCHIRLYPPDTIFDRCPSCDWPQPIRPTGERLSPHCDHCRQMLPPPGQRYLAQCPGCGLELTNYDLNGARIRERCPDCRTALPLFEPIPSPGLPSSSVPAKAGGPHNAEPSLSSSRSESKIDGQTDSVQNSKIETPPALAA